MTLPPNLPTPTTVLRLYRLTLRHAGAAVLYARPASPNLRALYRPEFDIWMKRAKQGSEAVIKDKAEWETFAIRCEYRADLSALLLTPTASSLFAVQNTLELFHQSSTHADLSHRLTKNLASMQYHMDAHDGVSQRQAGTASSTLQYNRVEFLSGKKQADVEKVQAWDAFAELVGMAEGSAGLLLGKVRPRKPLEG